MIDWKTNLHPNHAQRRTTCENLKIECGIFQGDLLSLLLFCLVLLAFLQAQ